MLSEELRKAIDDFIAAVNMAVKRIKEVILKLSDAVVSEGLVWNQPIKHDTPYRYDKPNTKPMFSCKRVYHCRNNC